MSSPGKSRKHRWLLPLFPVCAALILLLPLKPVARPTDAVEFSHVDQFYKGLRQEEITASLKVDGLEMILQLYDTSILPTVSGDSRRVSATYYELHGQLNGRPFTITADDSSAILFFHDQNRGYRLQNGHTFVGMIHAARRENPGTGA